MTWCATHASAKVVARLSGYLIIIIIIIEVIYIAWYFTDKGEHAALYKIMSNMLNIYIEPQNKYISTIYSSYTIHACVRMRTNTHTHTHTHTLTLTHTHTHTHSCTHTHSYTHIHTHTHPHPHPTPPLHGSRKC